MLAALKTALAMMVLDVLPNISVSDDESDFKKDFNILDLRMRLYFAEHPEEDDVSRALFKVI